MIGKSIALDQRLPIGCWFDHMQLMAWVPHRSRSSPINLPHPVQYGRFVKIDADLTIMT